jgi:hypothetical protein
MLVTKSTALASSNTFTPNRRTSWKDETDSNLASNTDTTMNEKNPSSLTSVNPFSDPPTTPVHSPSTTLLEDLESQSPTRSAIAHPSLKHRFIAFAVIALAVLFWILMIAGVLLMFDYSFPRAFRWYGMWKDIKKQMVVKDKAMDMFKAQVGTLTSQMGAVWKVVDGLSGMSGVTALNETARSGIGTWNVTVVG